MRSSIRGLFLGTLVLVSIGCGSSDGSKVNRNDASPDALSKDTTGPDLLVSADTRPATTDVSSADSQLPTVDVKPALDAAASDTSVLVDTGAPDAAVRIDGGPVDAPAVDVPVNPVLDASASEAGKADSGAVDSSRPDTVAPVVDTAPASDAKASNSCDYPKCLQDLQSACVPTGACTMQFDMTTFSTSTCYANGVKFSTALGSSLNSVVTWKNPSGVCYSVETSNPSTSGADLTWKNPAGSVAAIAREDFNARTITITCTGQSAVTISLDCGADGGTASDAGVCAQGACTF